MGAWSGQGRKSGSHWRLAPWGETVSRDGRKTILGDWLWDAPPAPEPPVVASLPLIAIVRRIHRMKKKLARLQVKDFPGVNDAIAKLTAEINSLADHPLLDGEHVKNVALADGVTYKLKHTLGRPWEGYQFTAMRGASTSGRIEYVLGGDISKELWLKATGFGATIRVNVYIF